MSRRIVIKKKYPKKDYYTTSPLVSLLLARILKKGKKKLASKIISESFSLITKKTTQYPLNVFELAVINTTPKVEVKARRIGGSTYQVPIEVSRYRGTTLALRWLIKAAKDRPGRAFSVKLANEIFDAANNVGAAIRRRDEVHRMAEANKAFTHFNF